MKKLYAPWRGKYITKDLKSEKPTGEKDCPFCRQIDENNDEKNFIIKRFKHCYVMLNLHPYNGGHIMILPYQHAARFDALTPEIRAELMEVMTSSISIIEKALSTDGINMGTNHGKPAGGSMPDHLHIHIVPRWWGDTNFFVSIADTKTVSIDLNEIYRKLSIAFKS